MNDFFRWLGNPANAGIFFFGIVIIVVLVLGVREQAKQTSINKLESRVAALEKAIDILVKLNSKQP